MAKQLSSPPHPPGWETDVESGLILMFAPGTGALAVGSTFGSIQYVNAFGTDLVITDVRARVTTAPTGSSAILDVKINGVTAFTTTANRPTIAASGTTSTTVLPDVTLIPAGAVVTVDVIQVGSTVAGSGLSLQVTARSL